MILLIFFSDGFARVYNGKFETEPARFWYEGFVITPILGKFGFVNEQGEEVIELKYELAERFSDKKDRVKAFRYSDWTYIDTTGKENPLLEYDKVYQFNCGLALVYNEVSFAEYYYNAEYGFVDTNAVLVIPMVYSDAHVEGFMECLAAVQKDSLWGFIDTENRVVIPFIYTKAYSFHNGLARVYTEDRSRWPESFGLYGYINKKGETFITIMYDDASDFVKEIAFVKFGGKYGVIDIKGDLIVPFEYDSVAIHEDGRITLTKKGKLYYIDSDKKKIKRDRS